MAILWRTTTCYQTASSSSTHNQQLQILHLNRQQTLLKTMMIWICGRETMSGPWSFLDYSDPDALQKSTKPAESAVADELIASNQSETSQSRLTTETPVVEQAPLDRFTGADRAHARLLRYQIIGAANKMDGELFHDLGLQNQVRTSFPNQGFALCST